MRLLFLLCCLFLFSCGNNKGNYVSENSDKLYYKSPVTETEAKKTLTWLHAVNHNFGKPKASFGLKKRDGIYLFQYPVQIKDAESEEGNQRYVKTFAEKLSTNVLNGSVVEIRLTGEDWKETKRTISSKL
jgi:hypothetical protein